MCLLLSGYLFYVKSKCDVHISSLNFSFHYYCIGRATAEGRMDAKNNEPKDQLNFKFRAHITILGSDLHYRKRNVDKIEQSDDDQFPPNNFTRWIFNFPVHPTSALPFYSFWIRANNQSKLVEKLLEIDWYWRLLGSTDEMPKIVLAFKNHTDQLSPWHWKWNKMMKYKGHQNSTEQLCRKS